jgi:hypothetical protein
MPNIENTEKGLPRSTLDIRNSRFDFWLDSNRKIPLLSCGRVDCYQSSTIRTIIVSIVNHHPTAITKRIVYFLRKEQPSVNLALPPVGWHLEVN